MNNKYQTMKVMCLCISCFNHKQCTLTKIGYFCDNCLKHILEKTKVNNKK